MLNVAYLDLLQFRQISTQKKTKDNLFELIVQRTNALNCFCKEEQSKGETGEKIYTYNDELGQTT